MARAIFGSFLVLLGLAFFSEQLPFRFVGLDFGTVMSLFWLVVGIALFIRRHIFWGTVFSAIGLIGFVSGFFNLDIGFIFLPVIFVAMGIAVLFKKPESWMDGRNISGGSVGDEIRENIAFASLERQYTSKNFKGGKIDCAFGGFKLDLRDVKLADKGAVLDMNCAFGGGEIIVPKEMRVISEGSAVMGGWTNKFESSGTSKDPALTIKGTVVFGGIEVKN